MTRGSELRSWIQPKRGVLLFLVLMLAAVFEFCASAASPTKPNFVLILADDLGWSSLSFRMDDRVPDSRSDFHSTPNLERLARAGLRFTRVRKTTGRREQVSPACPRGTW